MPTATNWKYETMAPALPRKSARTCSSRSSPPSPGGAQPGREDIALGLPVFKKSGLADSTGPGFNEAGEAFERNLLAATLERHAGNPSLAAQALGLAKTTLFDKVKKYGLQGSN